MSRKLNFHYYLTRITISVHEDQYTFLIISVRLCLETEMFPIRFVEKSEHIFYVYIYIYIYIYIFIYLFIYLRSRAIYEIMRKDMVQLDSPQITIQYSARILHELYKHTPRICNTYSFYKAVVARKRPDVTFYVHCLSSYIFMKSIKMCSK